jgi:glycogen operon protein
VSLLIARRTLRDGTHERERVSLTDMLRQAKTAWHGVTTLRPDWSPQSHSLAFGAEMRREGLGLHLIANAFWEALDFELPNAPDREAWRRWIDTSLDSPADIVPWQTASEVDDPRCYRVGPRSVVVLWRRLDNAGDRP